MAYKPYTMIGSRKTPENVLRLMAEIAYRLAAKGYSGRSGGADGADTALEIGVTKYIKETGNKADMEVYLPWQGFNNRSVDHHHYFDASTLSSFRMAQGIALFIHPAWDKCSRGAKALHSRNVMQLLGADLLQVSGFVICYGIPNGDTVKGGTGTAVSMANWKNVPVFNLYHYEDCVKIASKLKIDLGDFEITE